MKSIFVAKMKRWSLAVVIAVAFGFNLSGRAQSLSVLYSFTNGFDGGSPNNSLVLYSNTLYGTLGDNGGSGDIYALKTNGSGFTNFYSFTGGSDGDSPQAGLTVSGNTLYGTTTGGGSGGGTIFSIQADGTGFTVLNSFNEGSASSGPNGELILVGDRLYGTTLQEGDDSVGSIFSVSTNGTGFTNLYSFTGSVDGTSPHDGLVIINDTLYGTTRTGGINGQGAIFAINTNGTGFTNIYSFSGSDGSIPNGNLIMSGNTFYGTTQSGGPGGQGVVFSIQTDGTDFTNLHNFSGSDGSNPGAGLTLAGNTLYGTTPSGGTNGGSGTVFAVQTDGTGFNSLYSFSGPDGSSPQTRLVVASNQLYGTTTGGGADGFGEVFVLSVLPSTPAITSPIVNSLISRAFGAILGTENILNTNISVVGVYYSLNNSAWALAMTTNGWNDWSASASYTLGTNTLAVYAADTYGNASATNTIQFIYSTITSPANNSFVTGANGILTGTAETNVPETGVYYSLNGGAWVLATTTNGWYDWSATNTFALGTNTLSVYAVDTNGVDSATNTSQFTYATYGVLYSFTNSPDGSNPFGGLIQAGNKLYGTTFGGGVDNNGSIYSINTDGTGYTLLYSFTGGADGSSPFASMVITNDTLYGTTAGGGANSEGSVFAFNTDNSTLTTVYSFSGLDGASPYSGLLLSGNTLYGTTHGGGLNSEGTVFAVNTDGSNFTNLYSFQGSDGASCYAGLILSGSTLYGTTQGGGQNSNGTVFSINTDGSDFTDLHDFTGGNDGGTPFANLVLVGNTLYGTTQNGGPNSEGTVFAINTNGTGFTIVYGFTGGSNGGSDGGNPQADLIVVGNTLYGMTSGGGANGQGTVFAVNTDGSAFTNLYSFMSNPDGSSPWAGLIFSDNTLYGTTQNGGTSDAGTVFFLDVFPATPQIVNPTANGLVSHATGTISGTESTNISVAAVYYSLNNSIWTLATTTNGWSDWSVPAAFTLGANILSVFAIDDKGNVSSTNVIQFTYSFITSPADNSFTTTALGVVTGTAETNVPVIGVYYSLNNGAWTLATTSNSWYDWSVPVSFASGTNTLSVYALHSGGGTSGTNTSQFVYSFFATLHSLTSSPDGANPIGNLLLVGNKLYGTAQVGGGNGGGAIFSINPDGTGYATLYNFNGITGSNPQASLIVVNNVLWGTTTQGGATGQGTVFSINLDGTGFVDRYDFGSSSPDGANPYAGLTLSGNTLYGTTLNGGAGGYGTVFAINTDGSGYTNLYNFSSGTNGFSPYGGVVVSGDTLYGTTSAGSSVASITWGGLGTIFALHTDGTGFTNLYNFSGFDGTHSQASLLLADNRLYGTTLIGGRNAWGTVFAIGTDGAGFTNLYNFSGNYDGGYPQSSLILFNDTLYGTTSSGGVSNSGTIFGINTNGTGFTVFHTFTDGQDGASSQSGVTLLNNTLYGATGDGGTNQSGVLFAVSLFMPVIVNPSFDAVVNDPTTIIHGTTTTNVSVADIYYSLNNSAWKLATTTNAWNDWTAPATFRLGTNILMSYAVDNYGNVSETNTAFILYSLLRAIHSFYGPDGSGPESKPILSGNTLYGVTGAGGGSDGGVVYSVNTDGTEFTILHDFLYGSTNDGYSPSGGLVQIGNTLYGAASAGGPYGYGNGVIYSLNTDGSGYTNLYFFTGGADGEHPQTALLLSGNRLYGQTIAGDLYSAGTIFSINPDGTDFTTIYNFDSSFINNYRGDLLIIGDTIYGAQQTGGTYNKGRVYAVKTDGTGFTNLYSFTGGADGGNVLQGRLAASGGKLFGSTYIGGLNDNGTIFSLNQDGTDFTVLYQFTGGWDGGNSQSGLILSGNKLYGTTLGGGANGFGVEYVINTDGSGFSTLYNFLNGYDGVYGLNSLVSSNILYGTTPQSGGAGRGTVFSLPAVPILSANNNVYGRNYLNTWQIRISDLLTNAADSMGNIISFASLGTSTNGVNLLNRYGYLQYYNTNVVDDQFTYLITNNVGLSASGVITLTAAPTQSLGGQIAHLTISGGTATMTFAGIPNYLYHVQVSTNLIDWAILETTNAPANGSFQFADPNPPQPSAYYRLMWSGN